MAVTIHYNGKLDDVARLGELLDAAPALLRRTAVGVPGSRRAGSWHG